MDKPELLPPSPEPGAVSNWFPEGEPAWKMPGVQFIFCGVSCLTAAIWFFTLFFQLRGFVNVFASRLCLLAIVVALSLPVWVCAWNLRKMKPAFLFTGLLTAGMVGLDQVTLSVSKPEIGIRLVNPDRPAVLLVNNSPVNAKDIKWGIILWNHRTEDPTPLQIPIQTFDWIKAGMNGGPQDIFQRVESQVQQGDILYGSAFVDCPDCMKGKTYLVFITYGVGGWFTELHDPKAGSPAEPLTYTPEGREMYFKAIMSVPPNRRIAIAAQ